MTCWPRRSKTMGNVSPGLRARIARSTSAEVSPDDSTPSGHEALNIAGFDTAGTLDRLGGDIELYHSILGMLPRTISEIMARFDTALANGDYASAGQAVHAVRGMAANIGTLALVKSAEDLEKVLKDGCADAVQVAEYRRIIKETLQAVERGLAEIA